MSDRIDFANPATPLALRAFNSATGPYAERLFPLDADDLLETARRRTRLHDYGPDFREQFDVLIDSLNTEAGLHPLGRFNTRFLVIGLLKARLRAEQLLKEHPEIRERRVDKPIIIYGLPRTGTTLLQRLISQDTGLRSMDYWESNAPLPPRRGPDLRVQRARFTLRLLHWAAPLLVSMHEMVADEADEELWLMGIDFATQLFEGGYGVPSYSEWMEQADLTSTYEYLRKILQIMSWYRGPDRWLLKTPQHLGHLRELQTVFPDATLVQCHRDPVTATASIVNIVVYANRFNSAKIDPVEIGTRLAGTVESMLRRSIEDRAPDDARFVDVQFRSLVADPIATAKEVYQAAGRQLTPATEDAMQSWLEANPAGKHGKHDYALDDFGLDVAERRAALAFYSERFDVPNDARWERQS